MRLPLLGPLAGCEPDLIDRVEIETPCTVSWDSMYGDEQVRQLHAAMEERVDVRERSVGALGCGRHRSRDRNVAQFSQPG